MTTVVTIPGVDVSGVDISGVDMRKIQPRDAKAGLSAVVDEAMRGEPALIIRHGKPQAVIPGFQEWERRLRIPSFDRLLMAAPVAPDNLPARDPSPLRPVDF